MEKKLNISSQLVLLTEKYLTYRARKKLTVKLKRKKKPMLLNFVTDLIGAAIAVLIFNQYFLQSFAIPSGSMKDTLLIGDTLFVDKLVYGPEYIPGGKVKLLGYKDIDREDIIVFNNPEFSDLSPIFNIAHRFIYMLTFSLVDISKDAQGNVKPLLFVKRNVGDKGDIVRLVKGELEYQLAGNRVKVSEVNLLEDLKKEPFKKRLINSDFYTNLPSMHYKFIKESLSLNYDKESKIFDAYQTQIGDQYTFDHYAYKYSLQLNPRDFSKLSLWARRELGFYIPKGYVFPIGDNRDNSLDGRYFGIIHEKEVLGSPAFRYLPFNRAGLIH